ncbi:MAG: glycosyltransferase 87 family protein [Archangium sp.]
MLRLVLMAVTIGTNDVGFWEVFGRHIAEHGLVQTYLVLDGGPAAPVPVFNHPPVAGLWVALCWWVSNLTGLRFAIALKFAGLVAEFVTARILFLRWREKAGSERAWKVVAAYSLGLCSILVSAFHGNTDCVYAMAVLLAAFLFSGGRPLAAGLALALAINVKLIPVFAIPAFFAACRDWKTFTRFVAGLAVGVLPFVPMLVLIPSQFAKNVLSYTPNLEHWGVVGMLLLSSSTRRIETVAPQAIELYVQYSRVILLLAISGAALWARRVRADLYVSVALALTFFLILTPGFGVQYTVLLCPILFAVSLRWGWAWTTVAGLFIFVPYFVFMEKTFPWQSGFRSRYPHPAPLLGFLAWVLLLRFVAAVFTRRFSRATDS